MVFQKIIDNFFECVLAVSLSKIQLISGLSEKLHSVRNKNRKSACFSADAFPI